MGFINFAHCAKSQAEVEAFHPGPGSSGPAPTVRRTPAERLALAESRLLDIAIEQHLARPGEGCDLALQIVALRAEVRQ